MLHGLGNFGNESTFHQMALWLHMIVTLMGSVWVNVYYRIYVCVMRQLCQVQVELSVPFDVIKVITNCY